MSETETAGAAPDAPDELRSPACWAPTVATTKPESTNKTPQHPHVSPFCSREPLRPRFACNSVSEQDAESISTALCLPCTPVQARQPLRGSRLLDPAHQRAPVDPAEIAHFPHLVLFMKRRPKGRVPWSNRSGLRSKSGALGCCIPSSGTTSPKLMMQ